jgi:hypothetical protein
MGKMRNEHLKGNGHFSRPDIEDSEKFNWIL